MDRFSPDFTQKALGAKLADRMTRAENSLRKSIQEVTIDVLNNIDPVAGSRHLSICVEVGGYEPYTIDKVIGELDKDLLPKLAKRTVQQNETTQILTLTILIPE